MKYVTLFLANFDYLSSVTLCHTSRDPQKYVTHIGLPIIIRPSFKETDKRTLYKCSLNCYRGILSGKFCQGVFSLEGFLRDGLCPFSFCQNTSVTTES